MEERETEAQQSELPGPRSRRWTGIPAHLGWDDLSGYSLICMLSIRRLLLPLVNKLFRNYSDALCHQMLITGSVFLVGLHGAVQAASQAPESQASSKIHTPIILNKGQTPARP